MLVHIPRNWAYKSNFEPENPPDLGSGCHWSLTRCGGDLTSVE